MGKHRFRGRKGKGDNKGKGRDNDNGVDGKGVRQNYADIPKENASFEAFYKLQNIVPEGEWDQFMASCRESLPTAFRITGSRNEAKSMLHLIENRLIKEVLEAGKTEEQSIEISPFPLPWYPGRMAWQLNLTRQDIRRNAAYYRFHNFLISETESGNISRQEAVSMIPPLVLNVEPHHKVLDMCASPGSKTAQIIEMLHAEDSKPPEGYVVANDVDNKRCYMLVHQGKRLQSPAFVVTNHDAARLPDLLKDGKDGGKELLKFDRVLCDVPCSGDGTIRKNVDVWKKWNPANSLYLQQVQYQILKRGMELLAEGGLLVYSTCSLNPLEDEAVIHRLLKEAKDSVELLDIELPSLKHVKGLSNWTVCDRDLNVYTKAEDVPERWVTTIRPTTFPPSAEEAPSFHLDKCLRILPHQQNTGGFFIALLKKTKPLPWEITTAPTKAVVVGDYGLAESVPVPEESKPPPAKKQKRMHGFKEDPYIFMNDDHEIWPSVKEFYDLDETLKSANFMRRTEEGKIKNLYLTTDNVRDFVSNNDKSLKIINVGMKSLARIDHKWSRCNFRLSQEGLPSLCPYIRGRRLKVTKEDLILMLHQDEKDKAPLIETLSAETRKGLETIDRGSLVLICSFQVEDNGPECNLELVGWKGAASLRAYVQKNDRMHYLRLCGEDISAYEINKFLNQNKNQGGAGNTEGKDEDEEDLPTGMDDEPSDDLLDSMPVAVTE